MTAGIVPAYVVAFVVGAGLQRIAGLGMGLAVAGAVATGVLMGGIASRWITTVDARRPALSVAALGGVVTLGRGPWGI